MAPFALWLNRSSSGEFWPRAVRLLSGEWDGKADLKFRPLSTPSRMLRMSASMHPDPAFRPILAESGTAASGKNGREADLPSRCRPERLPAGVSDEQHFRGEVEAAQKRAEGCAPKLATSRELPPSPPALASARTAHGFDPTGRSRPGRGSRAWSRSRLWRSEYSER